MDFPREHWAQIASTNPLERVNREIKRRADVIGIFPNDDAIIRLARPRDRQSHHHAARRGSLTERPSLSEGRRSYTITGDTARSTAHGILNRDYDAVKNAIEMPWSNGQAEGQINRLKTLKRAMYDRAGPELLRARMLPFRHTD